MQICFDSSTIILVNYISAITMSKLSLYRATTSIVCFFCTLYLPADAQSGDNSSSNASSCENFNDLQKSLLNNETNRIALSITFFPLEDNPPEFIEVTYDFGAGIEPQVWYWSARTSHFLHPFEVLQFLSLFFNKPEPYYTGSLNIALSPECADAGLLPDTKLHTNRSKLQLLTQRLKLYAERGNSNIILSDTYNAKAYDNTTLSILLNDEAEETTGIIIAMAILVVLCSVLIIFLMLLVFFCSTSHTQSKWIKKVEDNRPAVLSLSVLSFVLNLYILVLAIVAFSYWHWKVDKDGIYGDTKRNVGPLSIVAVVDGLCLFFWFVVALFACCINSCKSCTLLCCCDKCWCLSCNECKNCKQPFDKCECPKKASDTCDKCKKNLDETYECTCKDCEDGKCECPKKVKKHYHLRLISVSAFIILSLSVLSPIFCVIAHSPYIAIAYLNDGSHASSMFIYYCILCFVFYGVMWLFFHWCKHYSEEQKTQSNEEGNGGKNTKDCQCCCESCKMCCRGCWDMCRRCNFTAAINGMCTCTCYPEDKTSTWCCSGCCPNFCKKINCCNDDIKCKGCCTGCCPTITYKELECKGRCSPHCCFMWPLGCTIFILLGLVATIACYFVLIPINRSITDAPQRILSIYQSGGFVIGSFIVYKVIAYFYSKKREEEPKTVTDLHKLLEEGEIEVASTSPTTFKWKIDEKTSDKKHNMEHDKSLPQQETRNAPNSKLLILEASYKQ